MRNIGHFYRYRVQSTLYLNRLRALVRHRTTTTKFGDILLKCSSPDTQSKLIPQDYLSGISQGSLELQDHLRWLAMKFNLKQDSLLVGHPTSLRRSLVFAFAEACQMEVEYLRLTRDTTEADLKQRRELMTDPTTGASVLAFHDQAPIRAAIHGRLLVLEGLEQVERNVLPTLNNLLENRECHLEDGRFLGSPSLPVHDQFRVVALCLQTPPYNPGQMIDPPLRSRFSTRYVDELSVEEMSYILQQSIEKDHFQHNKTAITKLLNAVQTLRLQRDIAIQEGRSLTSIPTLSLEQIKYCLNINSGNKEVLIPSMGEVVRRLERCVPSLSHMNSSIEPAVGKVLQSLWEDVNVDVIEGIVKEVPVNTSTSTDHQWQIIQNASQDVLEGQHIAVLGPKGCGKSHVARAISQAHFAPNETIVFNCYSELSSRDLLQRRVTDNEGSTMWQDSPLVQAARYGHCCVLDGVDRLDASSLVALQTMLEDRFVALPSGEMLFTNPNFRTIALGLPPNRNASEDMKVRWLLSDLNLKFHFLRDMDAKDMLSIVTARGGDPSLLEKLIEVFNGASNKNVDEHLMLNIRHLLRLQRLGFGQNDVNSIELQQLKDTLKGNLFVPFLRRDSRENFVQAWSQLDSTKASTAHAGVNERVSEEALSTALEDQFTVLRHTDSNPDYVPRPLFFDNKDQLQVMQRLLAAYNSNERAFLLVGVQGVGKNKIVDQFLYKLNREREYIQLHRDSTVQSLTLIPTLKEGKILYEDSPIVRAAKLGRVVVVDEADKAPLEVVCVLKTLAEDGEIMLNDGMKRLVTKEKYLQEQGNSSGHSDGKSSVKGRIDEDITFIHPDFRMIVLANPPMMPFLGNNFYQECGDVFNTFVIDNLPLESELSLLRNYGPDVPAQVLRQVAMSFGALRALHGEGQLNYPFSAREAVSVIKHAQLYPKDGVLNAIENVLSFENLVPSVRRDIAAVFQENGLPVSEKPDRFRGVPQVQTAPSLPLAPPVSHSLALWPSDSDSSTTSLAAYTHSFQLNLSEWQSSAPVQQKFRRYSSRISTFTEEHSSFLVGGLESRHDHMREFVNLAITAGDGSGSGDENGISSSLHVLTMNPLEVHSYLNIGRPEHAALSESYVRNQLLPTDMAWRLGHFRPLLLGTRDYMTVLLPELAMMIKLPSSALGEGHMSNLPDLKDFLGTSAGAGGQGAGMNLFGYSRGNRTSQSSAFDSKLLQHASSGVDNSVNMVALYTQQGENIALIDLNSDTMHQLHLSDHPAFQNGGGVYAIHYAGSSGANTDWRVQLQDGSLLSLMMDTTTGTFSFSTLSSQSEFKAEKLYYNNGSATANPGSQHHGALASHADERLFVWLRSQPLSDESMRKPIMPSQGQSLQLVQKGDRQILEVCDLKLPSHTTTTTTTTTNSSDSGGVLRKIAIQYQDNSVSDEDTAPNGKKKGKAEEVVIDVLPLPFSPYTAVLSHLGRVKLMETDWQSLQQSESNWSAMFPAEAEEVGDGLRISRIDKDGKEMSIQEAMDLESHRHSKAREADGQSTPRTGLDAPKHGKEDAKNEPHVGGNTWAGGTGGSDTAGLGGRGGPYRLDKGHTVHQVSDKAKDEVSEEAKARARQLAEEGLKKRLEEINMNKRNFDHYLETRSKVEAEIQMLKGTMEELARRAKERVWLKRQASGELDDARIVDGLTGEKLVFKKRSDLNEKGRIDPRNHSGVPTVKKLSFVVDVSGSMYRFNGQDRRLERMLEAVLLLMEGIPDKSNDGTTVDTIKYSIVGHSGDSPEIDFLNFDQPKPKDEAERYAILEQMVAHSQFCFSGDNTVNSIDVAIQRTLEEGDDNNTERHVFIVSDANFDRYNISPRRVLEIMNKESDRVKCHLILLASLGTEAQDIQREMGSHASICRNTADLPALFKKLLLEATS